MGYGFAVTCRECKHEFDFFYGAGKRGALSYCNKCGSQLLFPYSSFFGRNNFYYIDGEKKEITENIHSCNCGGEFITKGSIKCPKCGYVESYKSASSRASSEKQILWD